MKPWLAPDKELARLAAEHDETYARLSRIVGKGRTYIADYIRKGSPKVLPEDVRDKLGDYFRCDPFRFGGTP